MYNKTELEEKSLEDLQLLAKGFKIKGIRRATKEDIIYKVLDYQAQNPTPEEEKQETHPQILKTKTTETLTNTQPRTQKRTRIKTKQQPIAASKVSNLTIPDVSKETIPNANAIDIKKKAQAELDKIRLEKAINSGQIIPTSEPIIKETKTNSLFEQNKTQLYSTETQFPQNETKKQFNNTAKEPQRPQAPTINKANLNNPNNPLYNSNHSQEKQVPQQKQIFTFEKEGLIDAEGVLEIMPDGYGFSAFFRL